ncbi:MAG TPA: hypothetical protein VF894_12440 [Anaeromyxobacter sp.]
MRLDATADRVFDLDGVELGVEVTAAGGDCTAASDLIDVAAIGSCDVHVASLAGQGFLPSEGASGRSFTLRLSVHVGGGAAQPVDEIITLDGFQFANGLCGER